MVSWLPYGIVFGRVFASLRLCVKSFLPGGRLQRLAGRKDRGKRPTATARPGRGRIGQPCRNWGGLWRNNPVKLLQCIRWWFVGVMEDRRGAGGEIGQVDPVGRGKVGVGLNMVTLAAAQAGI